MKLSDGKIKHLNALADKRGVIAAAAMDQRGSLRKMIAAGKGVSQNEITDEMMQEFKASVSKVLTPHASAILLDPEYGLPAAKARSRNAGLLLAYEESGYDNTKPGRLPDLLPHESVKRLVDQGADAIKVLLYYTPFENPDVNDIKHAFLERVGAECTFHEIPFFLEFVGYDPKGGDEKGFEYAKSKPEVVLKSMEEFSKPQYHVDILKAEVPVNAEFVEGSSVYKGQTAYTRKEALDFYRKGSEVAKKPFIYLSAGVEQRSVCRIAEYGCRSRRRIIQACFAAAPRGKNGVPVYAKQGVKALEDWLNDEGVKNITAVNNALKGAKPWQTKYGAAAVA